MNGTWPGEPRGFTGSSRRRRGELCCVRVFLEAETLRVARPSRNAGCPARHHVPSPLPRPVCIAHGTPPAGSRRALLTDLSALVWVASAVDGFDDIEDGDLRGRPPETKAAACSRRTRQDPRPDKSCQLLCEIGGWKCEVLSELSGTHSLAGQLGKQRCAVQHPLRALRQLHMPTISTHVIGNR